MDEDLLQDLEELGDDNVEIKEEEDDDDFDIDEDVMDEDGKDEKEPIRSAAPGDDVFSVAKLTSSRNFKEIMKQIKQFSSAPRLPAHSSGPVEDDPEYTWIVQANGITVDVDNEMLVVHKYIRDHYAPRFPELESLIPNPIDYARTVKLIGNEMDLSTLDLKSFLPSATIMVLTVTATTTNGRPIPEDALHSVNEACDMLLELEHAKRTILEYVESRMTFIAPNLSALVGSNIAAKLMGLSGGVTGLSKIPACNIIVLGKVNKLNTGLSSVTQQKHHGMIYQVDMIASVPQEWKRKAARRLAAKVALCARIDQGRQSPDGAAGREYRVKVQKEIDLLMQPPPGKAIKALPVPDEGPKKRRGGKRYRKAKDRLIQTELSKAANRMQFGVAEEEIGYHTGSTKGLGLIGGQTGRIRTAQADARVKIGVAKKHQKQWMNSSSATSGLSSSVAFTPVKGIELENPEAASQRIKDVNDRYFGSTTFLKRPAQNEVDVSKKPRIQ
ncbi:hypothetical protein BC832DRAFT_194929 [Gaertneriomyces semiglobifer]|nr:hypothetical protein BC832DRAFT_194929 [Gaertneriomyces semiglobifer]